MCGKTPNGIKTGYSIGVGNDWNRDIPARVYPCNNGNYPHVEIVSDNDVEPCVQSPDIAYRMENPNAQKKHEEMMERLGILKHNEERKETVNHPDHYNSKGIEVIDVIRAFDLSFSLGNVVKYVTRAGKKHKDTYLEDLKKAKWYLDEEIRHVEGIPQGFLEQRP